MMTKNKYELMLNNASRAMRQAVRNVMKDRKLRKQPVLVWKDGKVVRLRADQK